MNRFTKNAILYAKVETRKRIILNRQQLEYYAVGRQYILLVESITVVYNTWKGCMVIGRSSIFHQGVFRLTLSARPTAHFDTTANSEN